MRNLQSMTHLDSQGYKEGKRKANLCLPSMRDVSGHKEVNPPPQQARGEKAGRIKDFSYKKRKIFFFLFCKKIKTNDKNIKTLLALSKTEKRKKNPKTQ